MNWISKFIKPGLKTLFKKQPKSDEDSLWTTCVCQQLISPTTSKYRMKRIINDSHDMIYYISMLSTTGGKLKVSPKEILKNYQKIKKINKNKNYVIGFGITGKTISNLKFADGLVVGSAICKEISKSSTKRQNPVTNVSNMVKRLKNKIV